MLEVLKYRLELPRRVSLASQAAAGIKRAISDRVWADILPGERRLAEIFQVSRPTIQAAVQSLAKDGWLEIRPRLPSRLIRRGSGRQPDPGRLVCIVMHEPITHLSPVTSWSVGEMRARLAKEGFALEIRVCDPNCTAHRQRELETFLRQNHAACCVLLSLNQAWQQWFARRPIPALLLGSSYPTVELPSLDIDYRSVCQHAAGALLGRGHRRIALFLPDTGLAGELASEQGFRAAVEHCVDRSARAIVVRHASTARSIASQLEALFESEARPTGLLVAKPPYVLSTMIHLLDRGLRIPDEVSLIARDNDPFFETVGSRIAHYAFDQNGFARRVSRLVLQMVSQGHLPKARHLVFPRFVSGGTLGPPPSGAAG